MVFRTGLFFNYFNVMDGRVYWNIKPDCEVRGICQPDLWVERKIWIALLGGPELL